jgi:hypothetical protein
VGDVCSSLPAVIATRFRTRFKLVTLLALALCNPGRCADIDLFVSSHANLYITGDSETPAVFLTDVSPAGDINGDGYNDILVAATNHVDQSTTAYTVAVVFGFPTVGTSSMLVTYPTLSPTMGITIGGGGATGRLRGLGTAGDFNMDGVDDFIVSDFGYNSLSRTEAGAALVIFGKTGGWADIDLGSFTSGSAGFWVYGANAVDLFGIYGGIAGDVNGDGASDIVVSALYAKHDGDVVAIGYVLFGHSAATASFTTIDLATLSAGPTGFKIIFPKDYHYKLLVGPAGDINNDGYGDMIIGPQGQVVTHILFGGSVPTDADFSIMSISPTTGFRIFSDSDTINAASTAGDFNNDGIADIILGCPASSPLSRQSAGVAYVVFGQSDGSIFTPSISLSTFASGARGFAVYGAASGDCAGDSVSGGADIDGDGVDDIVIGVPGASALGRVGAGMAVVLFGRANVSFAAVDLAATLANNHGYRIFGYALHFTTVVLMNSFDGDRSADVLILSDYSQGRLDVVYGVVNTSPTAVPTVQPTSPTVVPTGQPTCPTAVPTAPTTSPTAVPTGPPTSSPTAFSCWPGTHYLDETSTEECVDCLPGHFSDVKGLPSCPACAAGTEAPSHASTECAQCEKGHYAARNGTASCSRCTAGSYADQKGATSCKLAPPGGYAEGGGATSYQLCSTGTYMPTAGSANASCIQCPSNRITALPGSASPNDCFLPVTNFLFAAVALTLVLFVLAVYILAGRVHSVAYGRMMFIREAKEQYQWLIESVEKLERTEDTGIRHDDNSVARTLWGWARPVAWVIAECAVLVYGVLSASFFALSKVFFVSMIIWRNVHLQFPHLDFMDQITSALTGIGDVVGPGLLAVIRAVAYACNWFATLPIDLSAAEVTCSGSTAPITLLIDVVIFVRVICLVDCDIAVFLQTTFGDAHEAFRRALMLPNFDALQRYGFRSKLWLWLCSYVESSVLSPTVVVTALQLLLGFVSIGEFFIDNGVHPHTPGCDKVRGAPGYDKAMAVVSSCICYYLIVPAAYTVLKFLVPRLPQRDIEEAGVLPGEKVAVEAQVAMSFLRSAQRSRALDRWVADALSKQVAACKKASVCARALAAARHEYDKYSEDIALLGDVLNSKPDRPAEAEAHRMVARGYLDALRAQLAGGYCHIFDAEIATAECEVRQAEAGAASDGQDTTQAKCVATPPAMASLSSCQSGRTDTAPPTPRSPQPPTNAVRHDQVEPEGPLQLGLPCPPEQMLSDYACCEQSDADRSHKAAVMTVVGPPSLSSPAETCDVGCAAAPPARGGDVAYELLPPVLAARAASLQLREAVSKYRVAMASAEYAMLEAAELAGAAMMAAMAKKTDAVHTAKDIKELYTQSLNYIGFRGPFTDSVRPLVSLLQSDDSWLSWRFHWAYNTLRTRTSDKSKVFVFPLSVELRHGLHRPRRMGPILYMPWSVVPEDEDESHMHHQIDWNVERFSRLPPCGFLPVITCCTHHATLLANLRTVVEIYLCGVWNDNSVAMLGLQDLLDSCGVDRGVGNVGQGSTLGSALWRLVTCNFATTREVKHDGDGDSHRMAVSSILYAKLVPRVTLCLLFPYGAFVTAYVSNTVAYPLWCSQAAYLNDRLPHILAFEAWALAEERVAQAGNTVYWKVLFTAVNIFVTESRLVGYLFGLLQYLMSLAVLFFPSRGFLAFGTVMIALYSLCATLHLMVSVANIFETKEAKAHSPISTADPAESGADVQVGGQQATDLIRAVKEIRTHVDRPATKSFTMCPSCGALYIRGETCVCSGAGLTRGEM